MSSVGGWILLVPPPKLANVRPILYNICMTTDERDFYTNQIIDAIIAAVRYGDPKNLRNDLNAIIELYAEHIQDKEING